MEAFEVIIDILNELIIDKAFNKDRKLTKRLPFILIYYVTILLLLVLSLFLGINYILVNNIFGYLILILSLILVIMLILPLFDRRK